MRPVFIDFHITLVSWAANFGIESCLFSGVSVTLCCVCITDYYASSFDCGSSNCEIQKSYVK
jgi:hypothetical protein